MSRNGCEMVDGEGPLEPVSGEVAGVPVPADVVDQHIDAWEPLEHFVGQSAHIGLGGVVGEEDVDLHTGRGADLPRRVLGAVGVPAGDRDVRTHFGQAQGGGPADAPGAAGDQDGATGHRRHGHHLRARSPGVAGGPSYAAGSNPLMSSHAGSVSSKMAPGMRSTSPMGTPKISAAAPIMWVA